MHESEAVKSIEIYRQMKVSYACQQVYEESRKFRYDISSVSNCYSRGQTDWEVKLESAPVECITYFIRSLISYECII